MQFKKWTQNTQKEEKEGEKIYWTKNDDENLNFFLIPNKTGEKGKYLMPGYKQIDFIFVIQDYENRADAKFYLNKMKAMKIVETAFELSHNQFKPEKILNFD